MPPMIDGSLSELVPRVEPDLIECPRRIDRQPEETVLQLIAEPEGASGLIISGAPPHSSRDCLVLRPSVLHQVHRTVGRVRDCAVEKTRPAPVHFLQRRLDLPGILILENERFGL